MPDITISIDDEAKKVLIKRAKKNMFTLREQIENIIRKSAIRSKNTDSRQDIKVDDRLVSIFSKKSKKK